MGRPREHDLDAILDHARRLWVEGGTSGLTIRRLSSEAGVSNGALYNAFGSRDGLLTRVWCREADQFLAFQRTAVANALRGDRPIQDAVVAASLASAEYSKHDEQGARLLLSVTFDDLLGAEPAPEQRDELLRLRRSVNDLITDLSTRLWGRTDRSALTCVRYCVVDLPSALLLAPSKPTDPLARHALERAVRGILTIQPPRHG